MIYITVFAYVIIGLFMYVYWGDAKRLITPIYWMVMWPSMLVWTILANREQFQLWWSGNMQWGKIYKGFKNIIKIDIDGEEEK